jgi:hypothetical protein
MHARAIGQDDIQVGVQERRPHEEDIELVRRADAE